MALTELLLHVFVTMGITKTLQTYVNFAMFNAKLVLVLLIVVYRVLGLIDYYQMVVNVKMGSLVSEL